MTLSRHNEKLAYYFFSLGKALRDAGHVVHVVLGFGIDVHSLQAKGVADKFFCRVGHKLPLYYDLRDRCWLVSGQFSI